MSNGYPLWPIAEDPMETASRPLLPIFFHSSSRPHLGLASRIIISLDTSRYLLEVHKKPQNLHSTWETGSDACPALSDLPSLCWCLVKHHTGSVAHQTDGQQFFLSRITHISGERHLLFPWDYSREWGGWCPKHVFSSFSLVVFPSLFYILSPEITYVYIHSQTVFLLQLARCTLNSLWSNFSPWCVCVCVWALAHACMGCLFWKWRVVAGRRENQTCFLLPSYRIGHSEEWMRRNENS